MKAINKMFIYMVKQITQEMMMIMLAIAPVLAGIFFRLGIPLLEDKVLIHYGLEGILGPYYEYFSWLLAMLTGMLFAFVGGLVVLGEIDDNVAKYIIVTPVGMRGYLFSRILMPALISGVVTLVCVPIFSLTQIGPVKLIVMTISTMLSGIVTAMLVVAISTNKVEGMAIGKLSGLFGVTFFVPLVISGIIKYVFFLFPMFWIGEWTLSGGYVKLVIALIQFVLWITILFWRFEKKFR
ncbi:MAG: hypothetical protein PUB13_01115 [Lachnospiraceae bacterium]|nr:hypothetical protein [Lachnospiraceae bacterium]